MRLRLLVSAALLAALTAVCSLVAIPNPLVPAVPFTLQIFAVCLAAALLPPRWAFAALAVYLLLGVAGLPVFAGASAGFGALFSVTGGFLLAFPFAAAAGAALAAGRAGFWAAAAGGLLTVVVSYLGGAAGMVAFGHLPARATTLLPLLSFAPWDLLKAVLAAVVAARVRPALVAAGRGAA